MKSEAEIKKELAVLHYSLSDLEYLKPEDREPLARFALAQIQILEWVLDLTGKNYNIDELDYNENDYDEDGEEL